MGAITLAAAQELLGPHLVPPPEMAKFYAIERMPQEMQALLMTYILFPEADLPLRAEMVGKTETWAKLVCCTELFAARVESIRKAQAAMDQFAHDKMHAAILSRIYTAILDELSQDNSTPALPVLVGYLERLGKKQPIAGQTIAIQNNIGKDTPKEGSVPRGVVERAAQRLQAS